MTDAADLFPATTAATMVNLAGAVSLWDWARKNEDPLLAQTIEEFLGQQGRHLTTPIEELDLTVRAYNGLKRLGINTAGEAACWSGPGMLGAQTGRSSRMAEGTITEVNEKLWQHCKLTLRGADEPTGE